LPDGRHYGCRAIYRRTYDGTRMGGGRNAGVNAPRHGWPGTEKEKSNQKKKWEKKRERGSDERGAGDATEERAWVRRERCWEEIARGATCVDIVARRRMGREDSGRGDPQLRDREEGGGTADLRQKGGERGGIQCKGGNKEGG
jgi:hypothetical protein